MSKSAEARTVELQLEGASGSRPIKTQSGQSVALLQEAMSAEGSVYTLSFGVLETSAPFECVATVTASDAGNTVRRQFNVVKGTSLTLSGRVFNVYVEDTTPETLPLTETPTPGANSTYWVTCIIEPGTRPPRTGPTLYGGMAQIALHGSLTIPIPENAGVELSLIHI